MTPFVKTEVRIPPTIDIGAREFTLCWNKERLDGGSWKGELISSEEKIRLLPGRSNAATFETLIHEIIHEANYLIGEDPPEGQVSAKAVFITQALLSMGIAPNFLDLEQEGK
ncbi:hypothetical protein LCGC14_0686720 [marine sediment metagenome]|uniref:SprT-like domain-containing protein n=1 Tax=marine sediment metagenome TaxID=412755 RepID=A0A0F9QLM6_9ZZZZ